MVQNSQQTFLNEIVAQIEHGGQPIPMYGLKERMKNLLKKKAEDLEDTKQNMKT